MKKALTLLLLLGSFASASAQAPVEDALALARLINGPTFLNNDDTLKAVAVILKPYVYQNTPLANSAGFATVLTYFKNGPNKNPFLAPLIPGGLSGSGTVSAKSLLSSVGNIGVTNFTDGLARFLIQRSKEELNIAFFRNFQTYINNNPEIQVVFPTTANIMGSLVSYQYNAMLPALRTAFENDFNVLTSSLLNLRETGSYSSYNDRQKEIVSFLTTKPAGRAVCAALIAADEVRKGENVADILSLLSTDQLCNTADNLSATLKFSNLLSTSLRSTEPDRIWVTRDELAQLKANETALKLFFGLVYALNKKDPVTFQVAGKAKPLETLLTLVNDQWLEPAKGKAFVNSFLSAARQASDLSDITRTILQKKKKGEEITKDDYRLYSASIVSFLTTTARVIPKNTGLDSTLTTIIPTIQSYLAFVDQGVNCYYDIKTRNYSSLVVHVSGMYAGIAKNTNTPSKNASGDFLKYATFMANLLEADGPEAVKNAIEAAVLPVGSSSVKRETYSNIAVNAYLGPFAGNEYLGATGKSKVSLGATAPVGIAFSWGNIGNGKRGNDSKNTTKGGKSFSLFVPIIDVGAMAAFRLKDPDSETSSQVTLKNIIAPGVYGFWGFGNCPVSFGLGAQVGPQLRTITSASAKLNKNYYVRYGLVLAVDIPLLNLHTRN